MYWQLILITAMILLKNGNADDGVQRQKRCIVVQKQSGTHGDSTEGEEDRRPEIKDRRPDRRRGVDYDGLKNPAVEELPPELLKYQIPTRQLKDFILFRNQLRRRKF